MSANKDELLKLLEQQALVKKYAKLKSFRPYPKQREFIAATKDHNEAVLQAANQIGKTSVGGYMAATFATGMYPNDWPGRRFNGPTRGWVCGTTSVATRDLVQAQLCGPPGNDEMFGTGFIPRDLIISKTAGHGAVGGFDQIQVRHVSGGVSTIGFKSYEQGRAKFQGSTLEYIWCDEQPPLDIYSECLARLIATNGLAYSTFTPLENLILPRFREASIEARRDRIVVRARMSDAAHLTAERQEQLLSTFSPHERRTRLFGELMQGSGAVFENIDLETLIEPIRWDPATGEVIHKELGPLNTFPWAFMIALDFGVAHPFAAALLAHDRDRDEVHVLSELRMKDAIPAQQVQRIKSAFGNFKASYPHDGSAREKGSGETLASLYKKEGLDMRATHAHFPDGSISTEAGILAMIQRMQSGRFFVSETCTQWQDEFQSYHRKDGVIVKEQDDLMSATRIGVMDLRHARPRNLFEGWRKAAQQQRANEARHEGDPFYTPGAYD